MSLNPLEKVGGRKFVVALTVLGLAVGTDVLAAKGLSTNLMATLLGVLGAFSASNLVSKRYAPKGVGLSVPFEAVKLKPEASESDEPEVEQVVKTEAWEAPAAANVEIEALEARIAAIEEAGEQIMKNQQLLSQSIQALQRVVANGRQGQ